MSPSTGSILLSIKARNVSGPPPIMPLRRSNAWLWNISFLTLSIIDTPVYCITYDVVTFGLVSK